MTQIIRVLTYTYCFHRLKHPDSNVFNQSRGGLIRESEVPLQEFWLKIGGGLIREGGVLAGYYGIISIAVQVAFIISGCTHITYYKTLKHALDIDAVKWRDFYSTIAMLYPIVKMMVDRMCEDAKNDMRRMDQSELGSWSRAVTSVDGTWMTRGHHSKNATFSICNYFNGALPYYKNLCQRQG